MNEIYTKDNRKTESGGSLTNIIFSFFVRLIGICFNLIRKSLILSAFCSAHGLCSKYLLTCKTNI